MTESSNRFLVVHGHFYQPPRENPWIESVETQDSAAPYHDWNSRITAECYARNGASRIVNNRNEILRIVNNYAQMSFNFGPTLLLWLEEHAPLTYRSILEADRASALRFSGHGSAMAQVYNHIIMPLASRRDKELQVRWGIADFEHRFGRKPEGMWLAETAVDTETLEVLAEHGILFTVLAPNQCAAVRPLMPMSTGIRTSRFPALRSRPASCFPRRMRGRPGVTDLLIRAAPIASGSAQAVPSRFSSTTAHARAPSRLNGCLTQVRVSLSVWRAVSPAPRRTRRSWSMSQPTAKAMGITTASARWR